MRRGPRNAHFTVGVGQEEADLARARSSRVCTGVRGVRRDCREPREPSVLLRNTETRRRTRARARARKRAPGIPPRISSNANTYIVAVVFDIVVGSIAVSDSVCVCVCFISWRYRDTEMPVPLRADARMISPTGDVSPFEVSLLAGI